LPLREAISNWYNRRYHVHYGTDEMMLTIGASEAIDLSLRALLNEGDEVLIPNPSYVAHQAEVHMCGGTAVPVPTHLEDGFKLRVEELEKLITEKTKAILMCYPSNPTGAIMDYEDLLPIAEFAKAHDLIVISDEIYSELTYHKDHVSMASLPGMKERTIILNGFSKSYAMTGLRIGFLCAPSEFITACIKLHQYSIVAPATPVQHAAIVALNECDDSVVAMRQDYLERRDMIVKGFQDMGLPIAVPEGAFYVFPDISQTGLSDESFCEQLLEQQHVAVVPGSAFGTCGANRIRCSYASSKETILEALRRIKLFLDSLQN
jgi:aspartate transaminase